MKKEWNSTALIAVASLAALDILIGLISSIITTTTGITMASGIITSISEPLLLMVVLLVVDRRGSALLFMSVVAIIAIPLNYSGPPGFIAKVPIIIVLGFISDYLFIFLKRISIWLTAIIIGGFLCNWYAFAVAYIGRLLEVPGIDNFLNTMPILYLVILLGIMGGLGGILGVIIYHRIKNTAVVQRIHGTFN